MSFLRPAYDFTLQQAEKPWARWSLFGVSFAESSFFPIPPDVLLLPMALADRARAYQLALICTIGSVLGALLGYAIGYWFFATIGQWLIETYHLQAAFDRFREEFNHWGVWIILGKGLTPIPFKLVTIASGVAHFALLPFILSSIITRGMRFFLVAWLAKRYGAPIQKFVEKYLTWVSLGVLAVIIFGFWLVLH
jgi:membrane protein YqaA with SNARE-associated domain